MQEHRVICCHPPCEESADLGCSKCKMRFYCSVKCQVEHWNNGHKTECKAEAKRRLDSEKSLAPTPNQAQAQAPTQPPQPPAAATATTTAATATTTAATAATTAATTTAATTTAAATTTTTATATTTTTIDWDIYI